MGRENLVLANGHLRVVCMMPECLTRESRQLGALGLGKCKNQKIAGFSRK